MEILSMPPLAHPVHVCWDFEPPKVKDKLEFPLGHESYSEEMF